MTIVEEPRTTQVLPSQPEPEQVVRPVPSRDEPEPTGRSRPVRWLGWAAGLLIIALAGTVVISLIASGDHEQTTLTTADITEARMDARYDGPAQLPGGVLPANLMPLYDNPAQLPGGVLPPNLMSMPDDAPAAPADVPTNLR